MRSQSNPSPVPRCSKTGYPNRANVLHSWINPEIAPLTISELEEGLRILDAVKTDLKKFWNTNGRRFQEAIELAIRETSEALLCQRMSLALRAELEAQLEWLNIYVEQEECLTANRRLRPVKRRSPSAVGSSRN